MLRADYKIGKESFEDMLKAGRFNPCLEITFRDRKGAHTHKISAGYEDDVLVYRENGTTYVLSHNPRLGYVGVEVFEGDENVDGLFLQGEEMFDALGDNNLTPCEMLQHLKDLI